MTAEKTITERLITQIEQLPPMPSNIFKLRKAAADPNMNYDHIAPILKEDPSMCADLLRIANSARYGVGHNVDTVEEAIRYFGMPSLVEFVAAACSEKIVKQEFASIRNLNSYLAHSREISVSSSFICKMLKLSLHEQEVYSITGLLHDIGRLIILLVTEENKYHCEVPGICWQEIHDYVMDEKELYGLNHAELGMEICRKWNFPDRIIDGVHRHHTPYLKEDFSLDGLVMFLAEIITIKELSDNLLAKVLPQELMDRIGITENDLLKTRQDYREKLAA